MLINTVPDDCFMYIVFIYFIFNITFIVNVFMLSIEKKNVPNSVSSIIANKIVKWYLLIIKCLLLRMRK